ncbi:MAG: hypothetical protein KC561_15585 [Myxococcales bacterium]|nr:hypothetical protein [Myxococcales bacterium]
MKMKQGSSYWLVLCALLVSLAALSGPAFAEEACDHDSSVVTAQADRRQQRGEGPPHEGPPPCESNEECTRNCPSEFLGCVCAPTPHGENLCVPTCEQDSDCPAPPQGGRLVCDDYGICVPDGPPERR